MDDQWKRWRESVHRYFRRRIRDPMAVDDLVQDTCLRAWMSRVHGRIPRLAMPWVLGISWRVLADHRRERCARWPQANGHERDPWVPEDVLDEPREQMFGIGGRSYPLSDVLRVLDECVDQLPGAWGPLLRGRMSGHSVIELAHLHGTSENVIKLRLYRGRRRIKQAIITRLQEENEDHVVMSAV